MKVTLPLPPRILSPNVKTGSIGGRMAKSRATRLYRRVAYYKARQMAAFEGSRFPLQHAVATLTFYWPDKRRRDIRNAESSMKAAYDGLVDAGLIADDSSDHLTHGETVFMVVDLDNPRVEIEIVDRDGGDHAQ